MPFQAVLEVDLDVLAGARPAPGEPGTDSVLPDGALEVLERFGGTARALAAIARVPGRASLALAVGSAVRRGLPTAARASVIARSPATGLLSEGQIGGDLGPFLGAHAEVLLVFGRARVPGAVLVLDSDGVPRIEAHPELVGATPVQVWEALGRDSGAAVLSIGAGGEAQLPFASLAGGGTRPSFVGRGGLGAVLGGHGLKALLVEPPRSAPSAECDFARLTRALADSPRLRERAAGGTLELVGAFHARGDLLARNYAEEVPEDVAAALSSEAAARRVERKGCSGCPTPCGWVFEGTGGKRQRAHFSATYALGSNLGVDTLDGALQLLGVCDELAIDAKEAGAVLALACVARERGLRADGPGWGDVDALASELRALVDDEGHPGRGGAEAFACSLGLEDEHRSTRGQAARPEKSYAAVLGQCVATGGSDPMRSFPFLVESVDRARLEQLVTVLGPLPAGAEDPLSPVGKGRLVCWHENLVSAINATGFCAFSTAGLLADGGMTLDELAEYVAPAPAGLAADWRDLSPGDRLLELGANLVFLRRWLDARAGAPADADRPAWARARLDEPGMLAEYRAWRGLDEAGRPSRARLALLGTPRVTAIVEPVGSSADAGTGSPTRSESPASVAPGTRVPGSVELRARGGLGTTTGGTLVASLPLPASVVEVLHAAADGDAELARRLFAGDETIPRVWRDGTRLSTDALVEDGDVLELVTVIPGG